CTSRRTWTTTPGTSATRARVAGRCRRRSRRACPRRCWPPRSSTASPRAARPSGATASSRPCGRPSAGIWRRVPSSDRDRRPAAATGEPAPRGPPRPPHARSLRARDLRRLWRPDRRKLFPALYSLALRRLLPEQFAVVGVARSEESDDEFRERMKHAVQEFGRDEFKEDVWDWLAEGMRYVATDFADEGGEDRVRDVLNELDEQRKTAGNRVYYLAVPPDAIATLLQEIGERRSTEGWTRVIVEKPFGRDLATAQELNAEIGKYFAENEIFRIDHYLGKETVQNLLALRFANGIFEPIWNRQFVDHVQITVGESIGIEGRAGFYEQAGVIRDVFQNHLLQLVALTAMEPPIDFTAESVRNEKVKVLRALHTPGPKHVVRAQYGRGFVEGEEVPGYREEEGVAPDSLTDTYIAAKLYVDNWRWADTPFYVRAGKRLARRETTIAIEFKRAPHPPFEIT